MEEAMSDKCSFLQPLIEEARRRRLWLYCRYQNLWFSPAELEAENANGKFRWGPVNFELRDPLEYVAQAEKRAAALIEQAAQIRARLELSP